MTILDRSIFKELLIPFCISLCILCFLMLTKEMLRLVELLVAKSVGLLATFQIIIHFMPPFLVLTLPIACLISSIATFSRLSLDSELVAMRAAGLSLLRIAVPVFVFSSLVFLGTFYLSQWGQPWSSLSLKKLAMSLIQDQLHLALEHGIFYEPTDSLMIFVPEPEERAQGIFISDRRDPGNPLLITAKSFQMLKDPKRKQFGIRLHEGMIHQIPKNVTRYHQVSFATYDLQMDRFSPLNAQKPERPDYPHMIATLDQSGWQDTGMLRRLMEYYKDLAFPVATLILGTLGVPVGIVAKRSGHIGSFVLGIVVMVGYYLLNILGEFAVTAFILHPFAGAWLPNVLLLLITCTLFYRTSRR